MRDWVKKFPFVEEAESDAEVQCDQGPPQSPLTNALRASTVRILSGDTVRILSDTDTDTDTIRIANWSVGAEYDVEVVLIPCSVSGGMIKELLISFNIHTYIHTDRDGARERQFYQVLLYYELDVVRKACASLEPNYQPLVTFVVVQKRHHTRLFANNHNDHSKEADVSWRKEM